MHKCVALTQAIIQSPYDPRLWWERGCWLDKIGFPEIAAGDLYKSIVLYDAACCSGESLSALGESVLLVLAMCFWVSSPTSWEGLSPRSIHDGLRGAQISVYEDLMVCLENCGAPWDVVKVAEEALHKFPTEARFKGSADIVCRSVTWLRFVASSKNSSFRKEWLRYAQVMAKPYPWMTRSQLIRRKRVNKMIKADFEAQSTVATVGVSTLFSPTAAKASIAKIQNSDGSPTCLGVFAARDIKIGEQILVDRVCFAATAEENESICSHCCGANKKVANCDNCKMSFCSIECKDLAWSHYHQVTCGKDFSWLYEDSKRDAILKGPMLLRVLASCVQKKDVHPLDHPLLARLTPGYESNHLWQWNFITDIQVPNKILMQLGIDPFSDPRFDTWVIRTVWNRICNNQSNNMGLTNDRRITYISPLIPFFNHSCDPHFVQTPIAWGATLRVISIRAIKKGEEIFTSYINPYLPKKIRHKFLKPWLRDGCHCPKCQEET